MPSISSHIYKLGGAKYIRVFDSKPPTTKIPEEVEVEKSAFVRHKGKHMFKPMPFGIALAP